MVVFKSPSEVLHIHMSKGTVCGKNKKITFIFTYIQCYNVSALLPKIEVQVNFFLKSDKSCKEKEMF